MITLKEMNIIGEDNRGITCSYSLNNKQADYLYLFRKKGTISGNAYQKGLLSNMNPKTFILLTGKILLSFRQVNTKEVYTKIISSPKIIEINPYIIHTVEALEDYVLLECNSINDVELDRVKEVL